MVPTQRLVFLLGILMVFFTCAIAVDEDGGIQSEIQQANEDLVISNTSLNEQRVRDHFNIVRKLLPLKGNVSQIENLKRLIMKNAKKSHKPVIHDTSSVELGTTGSHLRKHKASKPTVSLKHGASRTSISSAVTEAPTESGFTSSSSSWQEEDIQTETGDEVKSSDSVSSSNQISLSETSTIQTSEVSDSILKGSFSTDPSPTDVDSLSTVHETGDSEASPSSTMNAEPTLQHSSVSNTLITETTSLPNVDPEVITTEDASIDIGSDSTDLQHVESKTAVESVLHSSSVYEDSTNTLLSSAELSSELLRASSSHPHDLEPTMSSVIRVTQTITHYIHSSGAAETNTIPTDTPRPDLPETPSTVDPQNQPELMVPPSPDNGQGMPSIISIEDGLKPLPSSTTEESTQTAISQPSEDNNQDGDFSTVYKYLTVHRPTSDLHSPSDASIVVSATGLHEDVSSLSHLIEGVLNSGDINKVSSATEQPPSITDNIHASITSAANDVTKIETSTPSNSVSVFPSTTDIISSDGQLPLPFEGPSDKHVYSDTSSETHASPTTLFAISSSTIVNERIGNPHELLHTTAAYPQYSTPPLPEKLKTKARYLDSLETKLSRPLPAVDNDQVGNGISSPGLSEEYKERHKQGLSDFPYSGGRNNDMFSVPHPNRQADDIPGHQISKDPNLNYEAERNTYRPDSKDDKNLVKPGGMGKDILNMKPLPYKISVSPQFQNHDATPKDIPKQVYGKPKIDWVNWMRNTKAGKNDNAWDNSIARPDNIANGDIRNKNGDMLSSRSLSPITTTYKSIVAVHSSTNDFPNGMVPSIEPSKTFDVDAQSLTRTTLYHSTLSPGTTHMEQTQNELNQKLGSNNKADLIEEIRKKVLGPSPAETSGRIDLDEAFGTNVKSDLRQKQDESVVDYMKRILPLIERIADGELKNNSSIDMVPQYDLNTHSPRPSRVLESQRTQSLHTLPLQMSDESKTSPSSSDAFGRPSMSLNDPMSSQNTSSGAPGEFSSALYAYEDDNYIYEYVYDSPDGARNMNGGELYKSSDSSRTDNSINTNLPPVKDVDFDNDKSAFKTFKNKADLTTSYKKQQIDDLEQAKSGPKESQWKSLSDSRKRLSDSAKSDNARKADSGEGKNLFSFLHNDNTKDRHVSNTNNKKNTHKLSEKIHKFNLNPFGIFSYESAASRSIDYIPSLFNAVFLILFSIMCL
ncbi:Piso0_004984 [Millerozyma farinosa CBS 7064]|uniref:Piso0_004984 protein n=1 Tax=Pichia sorbitophila (strain ATCC MYA-4447 / BCRC 22081 / CBS 7064 / NBRC 10061 / NRRL Y-12695) TaxID=559304 RepID=G8Y0Y6_PICSO|nr:Piso0_004984 [Millerozyma farinosa CBS 7064]